MRFSEAYIEIRAGLAGLEFSTDKKWQALINRCQKLTGSDGFEIGEASLPEDLRKELAKAKAEGRNEAVTLFDAAGAKQQITMTASLVDAKLAKRLGALKTLQHTYLLASTGAHKVWCVAIPTGFTDWPHDALQGGIANANKKLLDQTERFTSDQREHLSHASLEALKWVHKAMIIASDIKKEEHRATISRWFSDARTTESDLATIAATLNAGLKKIAFKLQSGRLIYTDSVAERGTGSNEGTEAFVWGDPLDVVYIEDEFFGNRNTLTGLTNWTRIVIHELTHRELGTEDYAYEHQGINPIRLSPAKAIENADSWAWFCADCAGVLTVGVINNALNRY